MFYFQLLCSYGLTFGSMSEKQNVVTPRLNIVSWHMFFCELQWVMSILSEMEIFLLKPQQPLHVTNR